ncbi:MAG: hypothetical protein RLZZ627_485 [Pseudomonadota bacterium]|jgi:hypothetical protein
MLGETLIIPAEPGLLDAGSGSYGSLVAYAANRKKSLSEIYLPSIQDNAKASKGYMRQIQDKLKAGEAGWILKVYRIDEF